MNKKNDRGDNGSAIVDEEVFSIAFEAIFEDKMKPRHRPDGGKVRLTVYLDSEINSFHFWTDERVFGDLTEPFNFEVYGKYKKSFERLPVKDCKLCVRSARRMSNEFDKMCWMDFGSSYLPLSSIKTDPSEWTEMSLRMHSTSENHEMAVLKIKMSPSRPIEGSSGTDVKSLFVESPWKCEKRIASTSIDSKSPCFAIAAASERRQRLVSAPMSAVTTTWDRGVCLEKKKLDEYFRAFSEENARFKNGIKGGEKIECPYYPSQVTVGDTQLNLPFAAYVIYEPPKVDSVYWKRALKIMYDRRGFLGKKEYAAFFFSKNATTETKAIHAVDMICQYAHVMEYVSDQVINPTTGKIEKIEIFGNAAAHEVNGGDCEDLAHVILQMFDDFVLRQFDSFSKKKGEKGGTVDTILREMQKILSAYVPLLCIEGVTCSRAQNQHEIEDEESITGAHAAVKFLPMSYFLKCLSNWNPNHPLVVQGSSSSTSFEVSLSPSSPLPGSVRSARSPLFYAPYVSKRKPSFAFASKESDGDGYENENGDDLPVLMGEGTGMLNSGGEIDPCCNKHRKTVYCVPAARCAKKPLYPPKATSPFYKALMFASCNRFVRDYGFGTVRFCKKKGTGRYERGVLFSDLIRMDPSICICPYGDDPTIAAGSENKREFSDALLHVMNDALGTRIKSARVKPPEFSPFCTDVATALGEKKSRPITRDFSSVRSGDLFLDEKRDRTFLECLSRLKRLKKKIEQRSPTNTAVYTNDNECKVSIYYDSAFVTDENCKSLYDRLAGVANRMDFCLETHSSDLFSWRLTFSFECNDR